MAHKPLHIYSEIYQVNYYVSYGVSEKEFKKSFRKQFDDIEPPGDLYEGRTDLYFWEGNQAIWIWTRDKRVSVLAHEIFHAAHFTLSRKGVSLSDDSDEAYAYLIGMLMRKILKEK